MFQTQKYKMFFSLEIIYSIFLIFLLLYRQKYVIYQHNNEKNRMCPTRKYENFGSLRSLAIIYGFFLSFWFSGGITRQEQNIEKNCMFQTQNYKHFGSLANNLKAFS